MSARDLLRTGTVLLLALGGCTVLGACEAILKAASGDRHVDGTIDCSGSGCVCKEGLGDCDGNVDNGCETDLADSPNCGACGVVCKNSACLDGACACDTGFADCDGDKANGCEAPIGGDPRNCGACHHDCGAGTCVAGACQVTVVGNVPGASSLEVTFGSIYVGSCNPAGPAIVSFDPGSMDSSPAVADNGCAHAITAAGIQLVWASDTRILSNPFVGTSSATPLVSAASPTQLLAGGDMSIYWWDKPLDPAQHALKRVPLAGGAAETVVTGDLTALTADLNRAYWSDQTGLHAVSHTGTAIMNLEGPALASALATDPTTLYAAGDSGVEAIPLAGGQTNLLATAQQVVGIAADGFDVFWADQGDGTVRKVPSGGGAVTVLASGQSFAPGVPIFTDGRSVYWLSGTELRAVGK